MLDFHKLEVYNKARALNKSIMLICRKIRYSEYSIRDQMVRASTSVLLNIAEGSGRSTSRDRTNFYVIAKGSAYECASLLDILSDIGTVNESERTKLTEEIEEISRMLFGLIKSLKQS